MAYRLEVTVAVKDDPRLKHWRPCVSVLPFALLLLGACTSTTAGVAGNDRPAAIALGGLQPGCACASPAHPCGKSDPNPTCVELGWPGASPDVFVRR